VKEAIPEDKQKKLVENITKGEFSLRDMRD
jgi:hypothetical protein